LIDSQDGLVSQILKSKTAQMQPTTVSPNLPVGCAKDALNGYKGFPLKYFDKESYLQRISDWFINAPMYLSSAKLRNKDPVFRLK